ncbi:MAG: hypothetical protein ABI629_10590 [bacterium]
MRIGAGLLLLNLGVLSACAPAAPNAQDAQDAAIRDYVKEVTGDDLKIGQLRVTVGDVTTDGRYAHMRGTVENRYDQPVDGIRYLIEIFTAGESTKVLDSWQREVTTSLGPGERKRVSLDVTSMYFGSSGAFDVIATPVKLGGKDMPPPPGWK